MNERIYELARRLDKYRCQVKNCGKNDIHVHHIIGREHGPTELWNLICLCSEHHEMLHNRKINIIKILWEIRHRESFRWIKVLKLLLRRR